MSNVSINQNDLDMFVTNKLVLDLINRLDFSPEVNTGIQPVFGKLFDDDFIPELDKRVKVVEKKQSLGEYIEELVRIKQHGDYSNLSMRAGISKEYWHKIIKGKIKKPSKAKLLCIAIALRLDLKETELLLRMAGYRFTADLTVLESVIAYFIEKQRFNIFDIDMQLERYNQPTIYSIRD
ncbi:hypothetical protein [Neobacillus drentensis]|uniref:hypothetical protein n=1 Tax=Neobacillus drentensis TaxID=220684 RepID=UPI002FFF106E